MPLNRPFGDRVPPAAMKTYTLRQRPAPKARRATCAEAACPAYLHGWTTTIDPADELAGARLHYLRGDRSRRHVESVDAAGRPTFEFEPGQDCFGGEHWVEMTTLYVVRGGDHRGNPLREFRQHAGPDDWVDDFANHQITLAERLAQG